MGTIAISRITNRAAKTLFDETGVRWAPAELLDYYNAGKNALVGLKPDAFVKTQSFELALAETKQVLPVDGIAFRGLNRNMGAAGTTPGRAIRVIEKNDLDHSRPDWPTQTTADITTSAGNVLHYMHDKQNPKVFFIWPRPTVAWFVELVYSAHPADAAADTDILPLDDLYEEPLYLFVVGKALQKHSKSGDMSRANWYGAQFSGFLGLKSQGQFTFAALPPDQAQASESA